MNRYPAKPMMDQMAQHGRYGDSMLVHMNPIEVAGIASLSPTGSLTTNPVTGQPEAFLPFLAPALGMLGGKLGLSALGSAALTGIGTAAVTGDLKRGLLSGLTAGLGSGLAEGIGGLFDSAQAGVDVATTVGDAVSTGGDIMGAIGAPEAALDLTTAVADAGIGAGGDTLAALQSGSVYGANAAGSIVPLDASYDAALTGGTGALTNPGLTVADVNQLASAPTTLGYTSEAPGMFGDFDTAVGGSGIGQTAQSFVDKLGTTGQLMGIGIGSGQMAQMDTMEEFEKQQRRLLEESEASRGEAYGDLQSAYAMAQPGVSRGFSPYRSQMSQRTYDYAAPGMAAGGVTRTGMSRAQWQALYDALVDDGYPLPPFEDWYQNAAGDSAEGADGADGGDASQAPSVDDKFEVLDENGMDILAPGYYGMKNFGTAQTDTNEYKALEAAKRGDPLTPEQQSLLEGYYRRREGFRAQRERAITEAQGTDSAVDPLANYLQGSGLFGYTTGNIGGIDPVSIQAGLREDYKIAAPTDYMSGFEPEFQYFQADPNAPFIPSRAYRPTQEGVDDTGTYFDPIIDRGSYLEQLQDYYRTLASYGMGGDNAPEEPVDEEPPVQDPGTGPTTPGTPTTPSNPVNPGTDPGNPNGSPSSPTNPSPPYNPPYNPSAPSGPSFGGGSNSGGNSAGDYYKIENGKIVRYTINSIVGVDPEEYTDEEYYGSPISGYYIVDQVTVGDAGDDTYAIQGSSGQYGEGIYYKNGKLYSHASEETLANIRAAGNTPYGIDPALMTDKEKAVYRMQYQSNPSDGFVGTSDYNSFGGSPQRDNSGAYGAGNTVTDAIAEGIGNPSVTLDGSEVVEKKDPGGVHPIVAALYGDPTKGTVVDTPYEGSFEYFRDQQKAQDSDASSANKAQATPQAPDIGVNVISENVTVPTPVAAPTVPVNPPKPTAPTKTNAEVEAIIAQGAMAAGTPGGPGGKGGSIPAPAPAPPPAPPPAPAPTAPALDAEQEAAIAKAMAGIRRGGIRFNEGGRTLVGSLGEMQTPAGGIAEVDSAFAASPSEQDVDMLASALLGASPEADQIIQMFLGKYGPDVFGQVRDMILSMVAPNNQNEGMIKGQGGGMDDMIPGMIGASQPVAVSPGEYIVPADVVSDLGDGSSDAGASELDSMLERVRMARGGTAEQPPAINAKGIMPR